MNKAEDLLRIKSGAKASKVAGRIAAEGAIGIYVSGDGKLGALVEVNCETDFVAKDQTFAGFATSGGGTGGSRKHHRCRGARQARLASGESVEATRQALVMKLGENIERAPGRGAQGQRQARALSARHQDRRDGRPGRRRRDARQGSGDARRGFQADFRVPGPGSGGADRARARHRQGAGAGIRQAGQSRRKNRRRQRAEVSGRGHPAGPAFRQGRQDLR